MEWSPDGETILTATTAPRLRIGNGFKVWHYSGALLHETAWPTGQELLQVMWQKYPEGIFTEKAISKAKVQGIESSTPQSSKAVYVPPNIRSGGIYTAPVGASPRGANNQPERGPIPGLPIGYKVSQGQRKKDRNAKRKEAENPKPNANSNTAANTTSNEESNPSQAQNQSTSTPNNAKRNPRRTPRQPNNNQNQTNGNGNGNGNSNKNNADSSGTPNANANATTPVAGDESSPESQNNADKLKRERRPRNRQQKSESGTSIDSEKDKRIRTVQQKLRDIAKLKARQQNGDNLEVNQLSKIGLEAELIKELNGLKVEA